MDNLDQNHSCRSPILFLIFNRPELTAQVFETIRTARPLRLYVAADGPRTDREGEADRVKEARRIATAVDWDCEVKTLFREQNLGCGRAVSEGITWFFEQEEEGIILEDDVLPHETWFPFVDELLERYRENELICCITALGFEVPDEQNTSYTFSIHNHCWGWASWRRAWKNYDYRIKNWPAIRNTAWLLRIGSYSPSFYCYWTRIFDLIYEGKIDTWDYQWIFTAWNQHRLSIHPKHNMVINLGHGSDATHTQYIDHPLSRLKATEMKFPLVHPLDIEENKIVTRESNIKYYSLSWKACVYLLISLLPLRLRITLRALKEKLLTPC